MQPIWWFSLSLQLSSDYSQRSKHNVQLLYLIVIFVAVRDHRIQQMQESRIYNGEFLLGD